MSMHRDELQSLIAGDAQASAMSFVADDIGCALRCCQIAPLASTPTPITYLALASEKGVGAEATRRLIVTVRAVAVQDPLVDEMQQRMRDHSGGIDIADPATQAMLDQFVALAVPHGLIAADAIAIKALAMQPQNITPEQVRAAR